MITATQKTSLEWDIILQTFPEWMSLSQDYFDVERLSGLSNYVYKIQPLTQPTTPPVVYKVFTQYFSCLQNRNREQQVSAMLEKSSHGPTVYYSSATSRIEQFWEYKHVSVEQLVEQQKMNSIAHELAYFHSQKTIKVENHPSDCISNLKNKYVRQAVDAAIKESILSKDQIAEMDSMVNVIFSQGFIDQAAQIIEDSKSPLVFCHNDTNSTNLLYDELNDKMYLLDYEYAGVNYRAFEFGNFFNEQLWDYEVKTEPFFAFRKQLYPEKHKRELFFGHYILGCLEEIAGIDVGVEGQDDNGQILYKEIKQNINRKTVNSMGMEEVLDAILGFNKETLQTKEMIFNEIARLDAEAEAGKIMSHATWFIVAALSFAYKELHFDCFSYCKLRFQEIQDILEQQKLKENKEDQNL